MKVGMQTAVGLQPQFAAANSGGKVRRINPRWVLLLGLLFLFALPKVAAAGMQTKIYPSASGFAKGYLKLAPDGTKVGFAYFKNGKHFVQINNKFYGSFEIDNKLTPFIKYSPDSKIFTFLFRRNGQCYLQLNDQVYGGFTEVNLPLFSVTGKAIGFRYAINNSWYLWLNGKKYGSYQAVEMPVFTADETGVGFVYRKRSKWYININRRKYGGYNQVWGPFLSGNRNHFGFIGQHGLGGRIYYFFDGKRYGPVDRVKQFGCSIDGQSFNVYYEKGGITRLHSGPNENLPVDELFFPQGDPKNVNISGGIVYKTQNKNYLQIGDVNFGGYQEINPVVFGTHYALWGFGYRDKDSYYIRVGERRYGPYHEGAYGPYFSQNEKAFAYWYRSGGRIYLNINNKIYQEYDARDFDLLQVISSSSGRITGYKFRRNGREYVRVGKSVYGGRGMIYSGTLVMSNNGACFGYRYRYNGQEFIQINEKVYRCDGHQLADFVITPDNKACLARIKNGKIILQEFDYN